MQEIPEQETEACRLRGSRTTTSTGRVLLAEDDEEMRSLLARALREGGHEVAEFADGSQILDYLDGASWLIEREQIDLIISDIRMPGVTGLELLADLRQCSGWPRVILITAFGDEETQAEARRLGATVVFDKPFEVSDLLAKVRDLIGHQGA